MPPQPKGSSGLKVDNRFWKDATGPDRYRRALYTFLRRTNIYPSLLTFDASAHSVSLARRIPTNTPLQALVTLNDPVYHEAAAALADRIIKDVPDGRVPGRSAADILDARLIHGARLVISRDPTARELNLLRQFHAQMLAQPAPAKSASANSAASAGKIVHKTAGKDRRAMARIAGILLNLDSALTR